MNRFFLAVLFGYLVGIVSAPKKGSELREDIKDKLEGLKKAGSEVAEAMQRKGQAYVETASPAVEQVQIEGKKLQQESEEIARNASRLFNESYEKGTAALEQAEQRIKEKAAPAISLVKDDANAIKTQGSELLKKASTAIGEAKDAVSEAVAEKAQELKFKDASNM
jgi:gas vesicle protein